MEGGCMSLAGTRNAHAAGAEAVLNSLPHPVVVIGPDAKIVEANVAAEDFLDLSVMMLRRYSLRARVPLGSPVLALSEQIRQHGGAVNEYKVDLGTPRNPGERTVDRHVAPVPER